MLDLSIRLRDVRDAAPAALQAVGALPRTDLELLLAFAQALIVAYEQRDPSKLVVVESRVFERGMREGVADSILPSRKA